MLESLIKQAEQQTLFLVRKAERQYEKHFPMSGIRFDLRGKSAGMAVFPPGKPAYIRYNPHLLLHNHRQFLSQTLPHEVSHLVARALYGSGIRPHGKEWKSIMAFFGAEATRCHNYALGDTPMRKVRRFPYRCACQAHQLSATRHHRILRGQTYLCRRCGQILSPLE